MKLHHLLFALLFTTAITQAATAQTTAAKPATKKAADTSSSETARKAAQTVFLTSASEYAITKPGHKKPLTLGKTPILNWTNPVRANESGAVYLWTNQGRPEVVGCCFTYGSEGRTIERHEFHTLSTTPLTSAVNGTPVWTPTKGIEMKEIPKAGKPAGTFSRRKLQMKLLARRFSAKLQTDKKDATQLRLIAAPLATYEPKDQPCQAGGLFSFAAGTDPEVLLLIECRDDENSGQPKWKYGLARYHYFEVSAKLDGKEVWSVETVRDRLFSDRGQTSKVRKDTYISFDK